MNPLTREKFTDITDKLILVFLTIQLASISFSIALSSISFGIWGGIWIIQIIYLREISYDKRVFSELKWFNILVLIYIFFEIISRIFAVIPEGAFTGLKRLLLFMIFYVTVIKVNKEKDLQKILFVIIVVFSCISIYEVIRLLLDLRGLPEGTDASNIRIDYFAYPITSGEIRLFLLLSVIPVLFTKEKIIIKNIYLLIALIPIIISMLLTLSRNVIVAFIVCLLIYGFFNRKFLIAFVLLIIFTGIILPSSYKERVISIFDLKHPSNESRITMWKTGWKMFLDHPLTGVGDNEITEVYKKYKTIETHGEGAHLHSNIMMILATTGIFGFLAYAGFFLILFITQIKIYKLTEIIYYKALILGSILTNLSLHISGIFEWNFGKHNDMTLFFFLIAIPFVIYKFHSGKAKINMDIN